MSYTVRSAAVCGIDAVPIDVEADISPGLPNFFIVGLPDAAVQESKERVRCSLKHHQLPFPRTRIAVNLAPAELKKAGPAYDLPIAIALLIAAGSLPEDCLRTQRMFVAALSLGGELRPVCGTLSIALLARHLGIKELFVAPGSAREAALADGPRIIAAPTLAAVVSHLNGTAPIAPQDVTPFFSEPPEPAVDFSAIRGQQQAKRAAEIAAAGGHNLLLSGPPGSGKTMLAKAIPGILPAMEASEIFAVSQIHSVAGLTSAEQPLISRRPFRNPHHTISGAALIGGGSLPRPGEVSLAHRGVLFLDEFPEFSRQALENLRQPLEDGEVTISRVHGKLRFPAQFMLIAAQNPCPCGFAGDPSGRCACRAEQVESYQRRISGPLLDRIDLMSSMPAVPFVDYFSSPPAEPSSTIRQRVEAARALQRQRLRGTGLIANADIPQSCLTAHIPLSASCREIVAAAARTMQLSARSYGRVLRVSRTIADLGGKELVEPAHVAEALRYRMA